MDEERRRPFTYNIAEFIDKEVPVDADLIPEFPDEAAARAAGLVEGDIFKIPGGRFGMVGVIPPDGRD